MPNLIEMHGGQPQKQPKYTPVFIERQFTGLYTQRNPLHDPSDIATARFYGGRPDALWMGQNVELTNRLTLQRRPGLIPFSSFVYPTPPLYAFSFHLTNGTIQVIVDTGVTGNLSISSVATSVGANAVYTGTFPNGANNACAGYIFQVSGFVTNLTNNGPFTCVASTTTTLTLSNAAAIAETRAAVGLASGAVYWDQQNGSATLLFGKGVGATQTNFQGVAGVLYMGDGVETKKYTPLNPNVDSGNLTNPNVSVWNFGGVAPAAQPSIVVTESGAAAATWVASTEWLTMGIIIDSNNAAEQLIAVANPTSTTLGTSGSGQPAWNQITGGFTVDNSVTWENIGPLVYWAAHTTFADQSHPVNGLASSIYDPTTGAVYFMFAGSSQISGANKPAFPAIIGYVVQGDGGCKWICGGTVNTAFDGFAWHPNQAVGGPGHVVYLIEPTQPPALGALPTQTLFVQLSSVAGTTAATYAQPNWSTSAGSITTDNQLTWVNLSGGSNSTTWTAGASYTAWTSATNHSFSVVKDANGSLQVCIVGGNAGGSSPFVVWQALFPYAAGAIIVDTNSNRQQATAGTSGGSTPAWNATIGGTTTDGSVTWTNLGSAYGYQTIESTGVTWANVGRAVSWASATQYYLPTGGFGAPSAFDPLGSPDINDGTNIEFVVQSGESGTITPTWNATKGGYTVDNTATWYNNGPFAQGSLSWTTGHNYAYSYKARATTDYYSTPVNGALPIPPGLSSPLPPPTGSETGLITTASPAFTITGSNAGAVVTVTGVGSTDVQFDTIVIWRDADGGGSSNMFELTEIPMPAPVGGLGRPWSFQDFLPDTPTAQYPGLNPLIPAPINHQNDPPPTNFLPQAYNFQRIWGPTGQNVIFSGGPDVVTGNPNEAFNPTDLLPFLATVTRIQRTAQGLITFTTNSIELIGGGPQTASFYSVTLSPGIGLLSVNALDVYAGELFFFSSDNQLFTLSPSLSISAFGFPVADQLANLPSSGISDTIWNPSMVYLAVHQVGIDNAIFLSDGVTGWYRLNPRQVPGGVTTGPEPIWSPFAKITNGCQMVQSVEYIPGIRSLLVGSVSGGQPLLKRSLTAFTDNGTQYDAYFVMGSIVLAHPGQRALLKFLEMDFSGIGFQPLVSFLANEISGTFVPFTLPPVYDPPQVYGATLTPTSYSPNRYYFVGTQSIAVCRHLQLRVDFGKTSNGDEIFDLTIFGRLMVED